MASTNCIWNRDLEGIPDACIWSHPLSACIGKEKCDTYDPEGTFKVEKEELVKCKDCEEEK